MRVAYSKDDLRSAELGELAPLTVVKRLGKFLEGGRRHGEMGSGKIGGILGVSGEVVNVRKTAFRAGCVGTAGCGALLDRRSWVDRHRGSEGHALV
ncbi:hypothetical protein NITMOv2_1423 [Nitrospira moscoviensis]|uniref:Uncharacterized protein n=1 Tax=Nitrospira moscoviensis TaxID=42253 RepID=A0A0K2GA78_NITMO|nr:hypothetical protein NITMOv2_1423 [Nitrospira moscoviensis]